MKKIIAIIFTVLALASFLSVQIYAQDTETTTTMTTQEQASGAEESEGTKIYIGGAILSVPEYFEEKMLPTLISAGTLLLGGLAMLVPFLQKNAKYNRLQGLYTKSMEELEKYSELLKNTDVSQFKAEQEEIISKYLKGSNENVAKLEARIELLYAQMEAKIELLSAQVDALIRGAQNAWSQSPAAVACLTASPSESVVRKQRDQIKALEQYITEYKGEEATAIISKLEECSDASETEQTETEG